MALAAVRSKPVILLLFFVVDSLSADAPNVCKGLVFSPKIVTIWLFYFVCILLMCVCVFLCSKSLVGL